MFTRESEDPGIYGDLNLRYHLIAINKVGRAIDPVSGEVMPVDVFDAYIDTMLERADAACKAKGQPGKLLIHVHGGLNSRKSSFSNAKRLAGLILDEEAPDDWHYPIFIAWPSGGLSSYGEYMWRLRHGRRVRGPLGVFGVIVVLSDIARGIGRFFESALYQIANDWNTLVYAWSSPRHRRSVLALWRDAWAIADDAKQAGYQITCGDYDRGVPSKLWRLIWYLVTLAPKLATQMFVLDALAAGGWTAMLHRIRNLFRPPSEYEYDANDSRHRFKHPEASGALVVFWARLADHLKATHPGQITLVGHSMGAIVINQSVRYLYGEAIRRIIYMAAACSIRETSDAMTPLMLENPQTEFHLLTLHPMSETEETNLKDFIPRGSLLEWIDNWYTNPPSHTHRRLGKWVNLIPAIHLFYPVKDRVSVKAFDSKPGALPKRHGDFNHCPFWKREFWDYNGPKGFGRFVSSNARATGKMPGP